MFKYKEADRNERRRQLPPENSDAELLYLLSSIGPRKDWVVGPSRSQLSHRESGSAPAKNVGEMEVGGLKALCRHLGCNHFNIHGHTREELEAEVLRALPDNEHLTPIHLSNVDKPHDIRQSSRKTMNRHSRGLGPSRHTRARVSKRQHPYAARQQDRPAVGSKAFPTPWSNSPGCSAKEPHLHNSSDESEEVHYKPQIGSRRKKFSKLTYTDSILDSHGRGIEDLRSALPEMVGEMPNHGRRDRYLLSDCPSRPSDTSIPRFSRESVWKEETSSGIKTPSTREFESIASQMHNLNIE